MVRKDNDKKRKRIHVKDLEFEMRTRITGEIFPNEVKASSEKCPGREDGESAKFSYGTFLIFGNKVPVKKQGRQQPNAEAW